MPETPDQRTYDYMTGEQFFTSPYAVDEWLEPFLEGGQYTTEQLAERYSGVPVVSGYYDEQGNFVPEHSLYNTASRALSLREIETPTFEDWLGQNYPEAGYQPDLTQTEEYQGTQELINLLTGEGQTEADLSGAEAQAALMQGFVREDGTPDVEAYRASISGTREQLEQGVMAQQGVYGTEYETQSRRAHAVEMQNLVEENRKIIEALGTRSSAAAYAKMTEISNTIADANVQYELSLAEHDLLMRQTEYEAMADRLAQMQAQGLAIQGQYLEQLQNNRYLALQGYAQNLTALIETNNQYLQAYTADLQAIQTHADTVYKSIMADVGVSESLMEQASQAYEQYMAPYLDELNAWYMGQTVVAAREAAEAGQGVNLGSGAGGAASGALAGAAIGSAIPGIGTAVGAILGGIGGFLSGLFG